MQDAFGTVLWVVAIVGLVFALVALALSGRAWAEHGKGGMVMDHDLPRSAASGPLAATTEREAEIRELLHARNARRQRRGEDPLDVEQELARLTSRGGGGPVEPSPPASADVRDADVREADLSEAGVPEAGVSDAAAADPAPSEAPAIPIDPGLREEVRQLVQARNHRRVRAGKPALDVEAEVERELAKISDL